LAHYFGIIGIIIFFDGCCYFGPNCHDNFIILVLPERVNGDKLRNRFVEPAKEGALTPQLSKLAQKPPQPVPNIQPAHIQ